MTLHHCVSRLFVRSCTLAALGSCLGVVTARAQVVRGPLDTVSVIHDSDQVVRVARAAQALFERRRIRYLPTRAGSFGGSCDEIVGRLCTTYGEGEWYPVPEDERIVAIRQELIAQLDSLQEFAPSSDWILGQRVWYLVEGGDQEGALHAARDCGRASPWWCLALQGFVLHAQGRYGRALEAFDDALESTDEERRRRWRVPHWPIDADLRDLLEDAEEDPAAERALLERMWTLADPLWMADGNDRLTAHYARRTSAEVRSRARNPFRLSWSSDLDQLTVRHGWEIGWERSPDRYFGATDEVVGRKHPEGRDYMPAGRVLTKPAEASHEDLRADRRRPRSLYAPAYAPVLLPMEGQVALFPRGQRTAIVATHFLPEDTTFHSSHDHPLPWMEWGPAKGAPDRIGLFALIPESGEVRGIEKVGQDDGALLLDIPTGDVVISVESWSPDRRRAGRLRIGAPKRAAPEDVATLSDVLLLRAAPVEPETLEEALAHALPRAMIVSGQDFAVGWEVAGLGFRPEVLEFEISVERTDRSIFGRIGGFLRISDRPQPLSLSWEEPGPSQPRHDFHYLSLDLPPLDPGRYEVRLTLRTDERSDAVASAIFEVVGPR